jgi:hypothetical protein
MEEEGIQKVYTFIKELGGGSFGIVWLVGPPTRALADVL